jgi:RNA polymerase sigma factor (sigma-70 family)
MELAIAAKDGNREARNALFLRHVPHFQRLAIPAKRIVANWAHKDRSIDTEDVDQQLFVIFCDLLDSWQRDRTPFIPYVISTMRWQALHYVREALHYRSKAMAAQSRDSWPDGLNGEGNAETDRRMADSPHAEVESRAAWLGHTAHLKPEWKYWLQLRFVQGMSSRQIAALHGCSRRTVNRELRAATQAVLHALQEEWEECA